MNATRFSVTIVTENGPTDIDLLRVFDRMVDENGWMMLFGPVERNAYVTAPTVTAVWP